MSKFYFLVGYPYVCGGYQTKRFSDWKRCKEFMDSLVLNGYGFTLVTIREEN